jgi:subtilase family serine protease
MSTQGSKPCVDEYGPYQVWAMVENVGNAPAGPVDVSASTGEVIQIQLLDAGESQTVRFQASPDTGSYLVQVDPQNTIAESDENNNMSSFLAPTPTPPALCSTPQPASP